MILLARPRLPIEFILIILTNIIVLIHSIRIIAVLADNAKIVLALESRLLLVSLHR